MSFSVETTFPTAGLRRHLVSYSCWQGPFLLTCFALCSHADHWEQLLGCMARSCCGSHTAESRRPADHSPVILKYFSPPRPLLQKATVQPNVVLPLRHLGASIKPETRCGRQGWKQASAAKDYLTCRLGLLAGVAELINALPRTS